MGRDPDDRYFTLQQLVQYSGLSIGTLRRHLKPNGQPLPHYRLGRRIMIRKSEFDRWLQQIATPPSPAPGSPQRFVLAPAP